MVLASAGGVGMLLAWLFLPSNAAGTDVALCVGAIVAGMLAALSGWGLLRGSSDADELSDVGEGGPWAGAGDGRTIPLEGESSGSAGVSRPIRLSLTPGGRIIDMNEAFCRASGFQRNELAGASGSLTDADAWSPQQWEEIRRTVGEGRAWFGELPGRSRRGEAYWLDCTVSAQNAPGGGSSYLLRGADVSERKRAEASTARSRSTLHAALESMTDAVCITDASGRFTEINEAFATFHRFAGKAECPRRLSDLSEFVDVFAPDGTPVPPSSWAVSRALRGETVAGEHVTLRCRDSGETWVGSFSCGPIRDERGTITGSVVSWRDGSGQKQGEQELRSERDAARAASRAKSEFLANMSHEIRTPLTAVLGYTTLLREDEELARSPESRARVLDTIHSAGERVLAVINSVLDLSRAEAERSSFECVPTSLPEILQEVDAFVRPVAVNKGIALAVRLESPVPDVIISEPGYLKQILLNLAGNAVTLTEVGAVIVAASVAPGGTRLRVDVTDSGLGMSPEEARSVFEPFDSHRPGTPRKFGGTWLGLTVSRKLAQAMGGDVTLLGSEPGAGTRLRLELPVQAAPGARMTSTLPASRRPDGPPRAEIPALSGRILFAEDGPDNQRLIAFHLKSAGAELAVVDNGRAALDLFVDAASRGRPFDLILTDLQMPQMDGYTLAKSLRDRGCDVPIVALTAHAMEEDRARGMAAGCDDYVTKPVDRARLIHACASWLGKRVRSHARAA